MQTTTTLKDVEAGYARVADENGKTLGYVDRRMAGSLRTGTQWYATSPGRREIGRADTRDGAVDHVAAHAEKMRAKREGR